MVRRSAVLRDGHEGRFARLVRDHDVDRQCEPGWVVVLSQFRCRQPIAGIASVVSQAKHAAIRADHGDDERQLHAALEAGVDCFGDLRGEVGEDRIRVAVQGLIPLAASATGYFPILRFLTAGESVADRIDMRQVLARE